MFKVFLGSKMQTQMIAMIVFFCRHRESSFITYFWKRLKIVIISAIMCADLVQRIHEIYIQHPKNNVKQIEEFREHIAHMDMKIRLQKAIALLSDRKLVRQKIVPPDSFGGWIFTGLQNTTDVAYGFLKLRFFAKNVCYEIIVIIYHLSSVPNTEYWIQYFCLPVSCLLSTVYSTLHSPLFGL